jgi:hypothetical protein
MAEAKAKEKQEEQKGQGRAVVLPNNQRRIDFIRDEYYGKGTSRSDIKNKINEMLEKAGRKDEQIPYQIVFSATKTGEQGKANTDPRKVAAKEAAKAE